MGQFVTETSVLNGRLELNNIPFSNNAAVKIIIIPKVDLSRMSFPEIWKATKQIHGNFSNDIAIERDER
ncbi:hypothetical protein MHK_001536 [Candidatus Magnetomorum sp. HK-1]|nr:hypothetical protein MHK_001536 [Candidatus Magnetomorum sp. HK-1]